MSHPLLKSAAGIALAKLLKVHNFPNHRIAALFDVNQGRVAEAIGERREVQVDA